MQTTGRTDSPESPWWRAGTLVTTGALVAPSGYADGPALIGRPVASRYCAEIA